MPSQAFATAKRAVELATRARHDFEHQHYGAALDEYTEALKLVQARKDRDNLRFAIARCHQELGDPRAQQEFADLAAHAASAGIRAAAKKRLAQIEAPNSARHPSANQTPTQAVELATSARYDFEHHQYRKALDDYARALTNVHARADQDNLRFGIARCHQELGDKDAQQEFADLAAHAVDRRVRAAAKMRLAQVDAVTSARHSQQATGAAKTTKPASETSSAGPPARPATGAAKPAVAATAPPKAPAATPPKPPPAPSPPVVTTEPKGLPPQTPTTTAEATKPKFLLKSMGSMPVETSRAQGSLALSRRAVAATLVGHKHAPKLVEVQPSANVSARPELVRPVPAPARVGWGRAGFIAGLLFVAGGGVSAWQAQVARDAYAQGHANGGDPVSARGSNYTWSALSIVGLAGGAALTAVGTWLWFGGSSRATRSRR